MWRLSWHVFRGVSALAFWTSRRLTPAGSLAAGAAIVGGALGVDTSQTLAYQVFAFAAAALAVSLAAARFVGPRFSAERETPRAVTAGQPFTWRVTLSNDAGRAMDGLVLFEDSPDPRPGFESFRAQLRFPSYRGWWRLLERSRVARIEPAQVAPLAAGGRAEIEVRGVARRRGTLVLEGMTLARTDPLGLVRAVYPLACPARVVVLPRRYALPRFALPGSRRYQHGGVTLASSVGDSEEFIGLREYRPGDPLQRVHWKSFARLGQPVVREYQDEFFERHALVLDTFAGEPQAACFEEAVSVAASFACTLDTRECLLDLVFVGREAYCYTAGRGQLQSAQLLEILAGARATPEQPFSMLAQSLLSRRTSLSGCILILLAWDAARRELVDRLNAGGVPLELLLVSEDDSAALPAAVHMLRPGKIQEGLARL